MKKTKKLLALLLLSIISLAGCDNSQQVSTVIENPLPEGMKYLVIENEETGDYYEGFVNEEDVPHGYGTMSYANGDFYVGNFENGLRQGSGTMTFVTACIYIGEWDNDMMDGMGYMKWPKGDYFTGEWKYGEPYYGTKYFLQENAPIDGSVDQRYCIYHGSFDGEGYLSGYGTMKWPSGDYYQGQWLNNVRHGYGTQYWPSDDPNIPQYSFVGQFENGWIKGEGTMYYRDGSVETGTFEGVNKVE